MNSRYRENEDRAYSPMVTGIRMVCAQSNIESADIFVVDYNSIIRRMRTKGFRNSETFGAIVRGGLVINPNAILTPWHPGRSLATPEVEVAGDNFTVTATEQTAIRTKGGRARAPRPEPSFLLPPLRSPRCLIARSFRAAW